MVILEDLAVKSLLKGKDIDIDRVDKNGLTPLQYASTDLEIVHRLISWKNSFEN